MKIMNLFEGAVNTGYKRIRFMITDGEVPQIIHLYEHLRGYCVIWSSLCFCSLLNTCLYCNNIESHTEKNGEYCLVCEALLIDSH